MLLLFFPITPTGPLRKGRLPLFPVAISSALWLTNPATADGLIDPDQHLKT